MCESFGLKYSVTYNPRKTVVMNITIKHQEPPVVKLAGNGITWVWLQHLGNYMKRSELLMAFSSQWGDLHGLVNKIVASFSVITKNPATII